MAMGRPLPGGSASYVCRATTRDGRERVVKVGVPGHDLVAEARVLGAAGGRGYALLHAHDAEHDAVLLESLGPALAQSGFPPERAIALLADTLREAWRLPLDAVPPGEDKAVTLRTLVVELDERLGRPTDRRVLRAALDHADALAGHDPATTVVLPRRRPPRQRAAREHAPGGGSRQGHVFVDPDGFRGDPAYDAGVVLRDWCSHLTGPDARTRLDGWCDLVAERTGTDRDRVRAWALPRARLHRALRHVVRRRAGGPGRSSPPPRTCSRDGSSAARPTSGQRAGRSLTSMDLCRRRRSAPRRDRLPRRRRAGHGRLPRAADAAAAAARGRARHRQDRAGRGARRDAGPAADPAAVLRGHRRHPGALRLGLPAPDPAPAGARGGRRRGAQRRGGREEPVRRAVPARPAGAAGAAQAPAVLLDRRGRPGRRRVRGVPARGALDLAGDHPRARHGHAPRRRRSSCSPPTAPASCTTRSSAAASTTGSTTPASSARSRSSARRAPEVAEALAAQVVGVVQQLRDRDDLLKPPGRRRDPRLGAGAAPPRHHATSTSRPRPPPSARW